MPAYNASERRVSRMTRTNPCDGCGRILPSGSEVVMWSVWVEGARYRLRFCSDCQGVIYGCGSREGKRRPIDIERDVGTLICRSICECCDEYPVCGKVDYQRESRPGDIFFGDLPLPTDGDDR